MLLSFVHNDMDRLLYPVDVTKPEAAYVTDPQPQLGDHQENRIIPFPFWVFPVNSLQELFDFFFLPGIRNCPISRNPDFGKQVGNVVAGKPLTKQKISEIAQDIQHDAYIFYGNLIIRMKECFQAGRSYLFSFANVL